MKDLAGFIAVARGKEPADLLLIGGRVVNVFTSEMKEVSVAIARGLIVGLGDYEAKETVDLRGCCLAPGFIEGHIHIESSMATPPEFARAVVPRGTTTVVADPHEIANVMGLDGIRYMLSSSGRLPLSVFFMLPSCVPSTELETAGAHLNARDLSPFLSDPQVLGVGEVMDVSGVLAGEREVLEKVEAGAGRPVDGHAPGLRGKDLAAYIGAGIGTDHESTELEEAREKLSLGMRVMIREGTTAKSLEALLPLVTAENCRRFILVTDDKHMAGLLGEGHLDHILRKAIGLGLPPLRAIQMVTLNVAECFRLWDRGAIAPGLRADLVVLESLEKVTVREVYKAGELVARDGELLHPEDLPQGPRLRSSVNLRWDLLKSLEVPAKGSPLKVMELVPDQLITLLRLEEPRVVDGLVQADTSRDILKVAVIERHINSGRVGMGFIRGFGLKAGALGSSVAHDSHNIILLGTSDADMLAAAQAVVHMHGGQVVVKEGEVVEALQLPVAGLMSDRPGKEVACLIGRLSEAARSLGCQLANPFMTLSFMALPVVPELKVTDMGLVDVRKGRVVPLFGEG